MTPSCEAEKEDQRYFNSPPHKKNHIATTMINTVFFKISTHILTKRMTTNPTITFKAGTFQLTSSRRGWPGRCMAISNVLLFQLTSSRRGWQHSNSLFYPSNIFQLTSSRRGWPVVVQFHSRLRYFNSHPHEEDDVKIIMSLISARHFNSHPHEEDDQIRCIRHQKEQHFNSHPHEEDDGNATEDIKSIRKFQLTSSRRGWLVLSYMTASLSRISTHILTKRMTWFQCNHILLHWLFQLTSSRRGWRKKYLRYCECYYFNSHPHEEDDRHIWALERLLWISTHILTKRMTKS